MPARVDSGSVSASPVRIPRQLVVFLLILIVFSLGNSADAFLLLRLTDALGSATYIPLLWAAIHVVKASLSTWGGELSDRYGRKPIIVLSWVIYAAVYLGFSMATSATAFITWFLVYGLYFALGEGAEKALVADFTPASRSGTAFGYYNAALGVGALVASVLFGVLYDRFGAVTAFRTGAALAGLASLLLLVLVRTPSTPPSPDNIVGSDASDSGHQR